jgi:cell division protein FtsQ
MSVESPPRVKPPIDPRIRARRIEVRRAAGRRRLWKLAVVGGVVAALVGVMALVRSPLLAVQGVQVEGANFTDPAALAAVAATAEGQSLGSIDLDALKARYLALPWVASASVGRGFSRTLTVSIIERRAAVTVPLAGGRWAVADGTGRVVAVIDGQPADFPVVRATVDSLVPGGSLPVLLGPAVRLAAALPAELRLRIAEIRVSDKGDVVAALTPAGTVELGPASSPDAQLLALLPLLRQLDPAKVGIIDLRAPDAPVVRSTDAVAAGGPPVVGTKP